jgi:hypothetical protein
MPWETGGTGRESFGATKLTWRDLVEIHADKVFGRDSSLAYDDVGDFSARIPTHCQNG